jgi:hypothetical protein
VHDMRRFDQLYGLARINLVIGRDSSRLQTSCPRHERFYAVAARTVIGFRQIRRGRISQRLAVVGRGRSGVARASG